MTQRVYEQWCRGSCCESKGGSGVQADAWNLRFSGIEKIYMTTTINAAALAQAHESDFEVKDPYERDVITACIPIAWHEGDEAMFLAASFSKDSRHAQRHVFPLDHHADSESNCRHGGVWHFGVYWPARPSLEMLRQSANDVQACRTFLALTKEHVSFREHRRDAPLLSGSRYRRPNTLFGHAFESSPTSWRRTLQKKNSPTVKTSRASPQSFTSRFIPLIKRVMSPGRQSDISRSSFEEPFGGRLGVPFDEGGLFVREDTLCEGRRSSHIVC